MSSPPHVTAGRHEGPRPLGRRSPGQRLLPGRIRRDSRRVSGDRIRDGAGRLRWASASDPLAQALEDNQETYAAGPCLYAFASGQPAVIDDATLEPRWREITLALVELQIRSALSVPVQLSGGPIGTLDVYAAAPGGWDATEVSALQPYAGLVATLLGTAAKPSGAAGWPNNSSRTGSSEHARAGQGCAEEAGTPR
jgi:GAF domain-containing protein